MDAFLSVSDKNRPVISVSGETDLANAGDLLLRLILLAGAATGQIELDLSQVTFMDCAGLRALAAIDRYVNAGGGSMRVVALSPIVARLFELTGRHRPQPHLLAPPRSGIPGSGTAPLPDALSGDLPARRDTLELAGSTEGP
jgi:anti-anti-sigma factor